MKNIEVYDQVIAVNVDVQNDFCPGGALAVADGDTVVDPLNKVNDWVRGNNGSVVFTGDWHPRETAHFLAGGGPWPVHCVRYTAGAAFHNELRVGDKDTVALKGTGIYDDGYSGWFAKLTTDSPLYRRGDDLHDLGIESVEDLVIEASGALAKTKRKVAVVIGGLATDYCVKATVLDALKRTREFNENQAARIGVFVLEDAIRAVDVAPGDGARAIEEMKAAGAIFTTAEKLLNGQVLEVRA